MALKIRMNKYLKNIDIFIFGALNFGLAETMKLFISKFIFKKTIFKLNLNKYFSGCSFLIRNSEDSTVFIEHFLTDYYSVILKQKVTNFVLVDCGSFNGVESLRLYGNLKKQVKKFYFICIEPNKYNYSTLKHNLKSIKNTTFYNNAIHNKSGLALIEKKAGELNQSFTYNEGKSYSKETVQSIDINKIIEENDLKHIDILKIDIEGNEENLFSRNISWIQKVNCLILEIYHVSEIKNLSRILNTLNKYNDFELHNYKENLVFIKKNSNLTFKVSRGINS